MYSCGQSIYSVRFPFFSLPLFVLPSFFLLFLHSSRFVLCSSFSFHPYSFYSSHSFLFSLSCSLPPFIIFFFSFFLPLSFLTLLNLFILSSHPYSFYSSPPSLLTFTFRFLFSILPFSLICSFFLSFLISSIFQPSFLFLFLPLLFFLPPLLFYSFLFSPFHPYSSSIRSLFFISFFIIHSSFLLGPCGYPAIS